MNSSSLPSFECQQYRELLDLSAAINLFTNPEEWLFQLKYDGIWARVEIDDGMARIYSKTNQLKHSFQTSYKNPNRIVLIGEYMYGSQWSQKRDRAGVIYIFDCVVEDGKDVSTLPYVARLKIAHQQVEKLEGKFQEVFSYRVDLIGEVWRTLSTSMDYEGLVVRKRASTYFADLYKLKTEIEDDFIATHLVEGEGKHKGRLGSVEMSKFRGNELVKIMDVGGGFTDEQREYYWRHGNEILSKVCLVQGKSRFDSGAFRHPTFIRVRDDKYPQECKL
jgi:ATP-dependent DNA ligase